MYCPESFLRPILRKEEAMKRNSSIKSALVPCILALLLICFSCLPATTEAQTDWGSKPSKTADKTAVPAYTPPPDQMIYFRTGPKEKSIGVTASNVNVPGLAPDLNYLKQTIEALEDAGYEVPENPARAAVQVRVTVTYNQVDNSKAIAHETGGKAVAGAILGALGGLAAGGGGQGAAQGAAGGAAYGLSSGTATPTVVKYLTFDFDVSNKKGVTQTGRVTKDITNIEMKPEEFIDAAIADYVEASFPKKR
jgi:outer membrane lipoprotein SlyB